MVLCSNARRDDDGHSSGDPTEVALLDAAATLGQTLASEQREHIRRGQFHFDPTRKLMTTVDDYDGALRLHTKGAPEAVLPRCATILDPDGHEDELDDPRRSSLASAVDALASEGLRVLAFAVRSLAPGVPAPTDRDDAETNLTFLGLAAMLDPPRVEVTDAVARCHTAGIRIIMVTGDHPLTASAIAKEVGIVQAHPYGRHRRRAGKAQRGRARRRCSGRKVG